MVEDKAKEADGWAGFVLDGIARIKKAIEELPKSTGLEFPKTSEDIVRIQKSFSEEITPYVLKRCGPKGMKKAECEVRTMDIWERIKEDLKTAIDNRELAEQLKDEWGYQYWRARVDALDLLLLSKVRCRDGGKEG